MSRAKMEPLDVMSRFMIRGIPLIRTIRIRSVSTRVDPNKVYGLNTKYGWFSIASDHYADDWTLPQIYQSLESKYPNIAKKPPTPVQIQNVIDEWVANTDNKSRPPHTKMNRRDKQELVDLQLFKFQLRKVEKSSPEAKEKQTKQKLQDAIRKRKEHAEQKQKIGEYIAEKGKLPKDYNFKGVTMLNAWNHFYAKNYLSDEPARSKSNAAQVWGKMSGKEKEKVRAEYVELLKKGLSYEKGELISLKKKYAVYLRRKSSGESSGANEETERSEGTD